MTDKLCDRCINKDEDWFDGRNGQLIETSFCAASRPQFPVATYCPTFEPVEVLDAD